MPLPSPHALRLLTLLGVGLLGVGSSTTRGAEIQILVEAGPHRRDATPVSFTIPTGVRPSQAWELRATDGSSRPLQFTEGQAWFIETNLPAGESRTYQLQRSRRGARNQPEAVTSTWDNHDLEVRFDGQPVFRYLAHEGHLPRTNIPPIYRRGGYFHPVFTPSGRRVTDDYPPNHVHHHGVWSAWTKTRFQGRSPDFWNMGQGKGRVDFAGFDRVQAGPVFARMEARQVHTDTLVTPAVQVLEEVWRATAYAIRLPEGPPVHLFDLESSQRLLTEHPLELPKYYYGGLGFRGPWAWNGATNALYLDANGVTDRIAGNGTRARWYWIGGQVDGSLAGIAVLGHPGNFRAPQPLRVHPTEPFVCWAPSHLADASIQPGKPLVSQYRFVTFDGPPDAARLERLWADFAEPPSVRVLPTASE